MSPASGGFAPRPPPGLCPWTPLGDLRPPDPLFVPPSRFLATPLLAESLLRTFNVDTRRRLRSVDSAMLVVPFTRRSTLGDRAFPLASACAWNSLPSSVRNAPSLTTFRRELKTVLFLVVV